MPVQHTPRRSEGLSATLCSAPLTDGSNAFSVVLEDDDGNMVIVPAVDEAGAQVILAALESHALANVDDTLQEKKPD